ncbi:MAG: hypothetical protein ACJ78Q_20915 [Chloroflexia bacterium]|jgi:hypothetical protein
MFLGWFDDTPKKSVVEKIKEAVERYMVKFGEAPNVCLVSPGEVVTVDGVEVKAVEYVRPNHFWVGRVEAPAGAPLAA